AFCAGAAVRAAGGRSSRICDRNRHGASSSNLRGGDRGSKLFRGHKGSCLVGTVELDNRSAVKVAAVDRQRKGRITCIRTVRRKFSNGGNNSRLRSGGFRG